MTKYVTHEACPECRKNGKDQHGDNLGRYPDGSAYCFSCRYIEPPTRLIKPHKEPKLADPLSNLHTTLPGAYDEWLSKYGLTPKEKALFSWSPDLKRMIYTFKVDNNVRFWEGRSLFTQPKTISSGNKPYHLLNYGHQTVCIVEDIVSAIKVSRYCTAFPLFGSSLSPVHELFLASEFTQILIWLDADKYDEAVKMSRKLALYGNNVEVIRTDKDPKECAVDLILSSRITFI